MNKITLLLLFISSILYAQEDTINHSAIKHPKYLENPTEYLSKINHNLIPTQILIDRVLFNDLILKVNGKDKVTSINYSDFYSFYQMFKYSLNDTSEMVPFDSLLQYSDLSYDYDQTNLISILDVNFNQISPAAIVNNDFTEGNDYLINNKANASSFLTNRVVAFTMFTHNIFGNKIKFKVPSALFLSNQENLVLQSVQIDFGNREGYKTVNFDEEIEVNYYLNFNYTEIRLKIEYLNTDNNQTETVYAHHATYRNVDEVNSFYKSTFNALFKVPKPHKTIYFPERQEIQLTNKLCPDNYWVRKLKFCKRTVTYWSYKPYTLEVSILFNPENKSGGKLRKPFIMVDGFDPEDKRNYFLTRLNNPDDLLPKEKDYRGLFNFLDGERSPWDPSTENNSNMVKALFDDGYDLIFVNFKIGAGDINKNAERVREFFNDVINSPKFRDNKTEEAILVGPSMGGLITRIALREMELAGEEHYVKSWISLDSPHKGASIPIALQYAIKFGTKFKPSILSPFKPNPMDAALKKLDTYAANQLLLHHYSNTWDQANPHPHHIALQNKISELKYPVISKNYAITNGGEGNLYNNRERIIDFYPTFYTFLKGWGNYTSGSGQIFEGKRQSAFNDEKKSTSNHLAIERSPGGWIGALYSINYHKDNSKKASDAWKEHEDNKRLHGQISNFIPTCSAFGIEVNHDNLFKTHKDFTNINDTISGKIRTPFDAIHGMKDNEEHVKISVETKEQVIERWLQPDNSVTTRPVIRVGEPIHQIATKPVAYLVKQEIAFAGNGNTFTFQNGADANIVAGKNIKFSPGFTIQSGAKMNAKIQVQQDVILKNAAFETANSSVNRDYLNPSPYHQKVYNYDISDVTEEIKSYIKLQIFPNPVQDFVNLSIEEENDNLNTVNIHDVNGKLIFSEQIISNQNKVIDTQHWARGVYFVTVNGKNNIQKTKIVK